MRRGVLDGQELAGVGVVLHVAVGPHEQLVAGDKTAAPAGHVEGLAGGVQFDAHLLRAGRGQEAQRLALEDQRRVGRIVDDDQAVAAARTPRLARRTPAWRSRRSGCSDNSAPAPWPCSSTSAGTESRSGRKSFASRQRQVMDPPAEYLRVRAEDRVARHGHQHVIARVDRAPPAGWTAPPCCRSSA